MGWWGVEGGGGMNGQRQMEQESHRKVCAEQAAAFIFTTRGNRAFGILHEP